MLDLTFIDSAKDMSSNEVERLERELLAEIAENIGCFEWKYDGDNKVHDGPIAQALVNCKGLKDAVLDNNGTLMIDTKFISLATLGYVAALTRVISGIKLKEPSQTIKEANQIIEREGITNANEQ